MVLEKLKMEEEGITSKEDDIIEDDIIEDEEINE